MAEPGGCPGDIHGHIPTADHQYPFAQIEVVSSQINIDQKIDSPQDTI